MKNNLQEKINKYNKSKSKSKEIKLVFTRELPTKEGYYWWTNFGEHSPVVLQVFKANGKLWASNEEFSFKIEMIDLKRIKEENEEIGLTTRVDGYYYGEELWCYIPNPYLPGGTEQVEPDCY